MNEQLLKRFCQHNSTCIYKQNFLSTIRKLSSPFGIIQSVQGEPQKPLLSKLKGLLQDRDKHVKLLGQIITWSE